jgi:superfamily I DNA and/or RNA helicase
MVPGVERVAFIGDRSQLPPFGDDEEGEAVSSAFNSFINVGGDPHFLEIQYRVPSPIAEILSRVSYQGRLQTWEGKIIPTSECLMWIDVAGEQLATGGSRSNIAEAETIANTIIHLRTDEGNAHNSPLLLPGSAGADPKELVRGSRRRSVDRRQLSRART